MWKRPAAWLPQGTGEHAAFEAWKKSGGTMTLEEAQEVFRQSYAEETNRYAEETPNFKFWSRSGPYDGEADIERRYHLGLEQVARFIEYYTEVAPDEKPWVTPDGDLAVELPFEVMLGDVPVRGYIDEVIELSKSLRVRDNKSGKDPGGPMQVATYGAAVELMWPGTVVSTGDYFMGRTGKPTVPYKLKDWPVEWLIEEFGKLEENIKAENFEPKPEKSKCTFCSVSASCKYAVFS